MRMGMCTTGRCALAGFLSFALELTPLSFSLSQTWEDLKRQGLL